MDWTFALGLLASVVITLAYVPQTFHTIKTKHTRGLSLHWLVLLDLGQVLYTIYGFLVPSIPIIISSGLGLVMVSILLAYKLEYK